MDDTNAQWIWQKDDVDDAAFHHVFELSSQPSEAWLRITADNA